MSFNRAQKAVGREHRERGQLIDRKHLGLLEKKKDWIQRTRAHQKKSNKLKKLRTKALERNQDEFDFHMVNSQVGFDGIHREAKHTDPEESFVQNLLNDVTDINYVRHKLALERKKIDKLKSVLHMTDSNAKRNTHTFFVEDDQEVSELTTEKLFGISSSLIDRKSNRIPEEKLRSQAIAVADKASAMEIEKQRHAMYEELDKRVKRERELNIVLQKLELKKAVQMTNRMDKPKLISKATNEKPACFKWKFERKK
uniref:U3 small nucleolar RNA-associated protein 11 n=2 Tax=Bursaphelenchus xylophilus TaxID=6326 RepID=A0A1I7SUA6_BURXY